MCHIIGLEVQKILAAVDWFEHENQHHSLPVGVFGYGNSRSSRSSSGSTKESWNGSPSSLSSIQRIGFYGISYGGKTAMRVPPFVDRYALSICTADFNEWVWKTTSVESPYEFAASLILLL